MNKIYAINHYNFIDRIIIKKRKEMCNIINRELFDKIFSNALDVGAGANGSVILLGLSFKFFKFIFSKINESTSDDNPHGLHP